MNIVILAGGIDEHGVLPSHVITRLQKAIEMYKSHPGSLLITSGKYSFLYPKDRLPIRTESEAMRAYLIDHGVKDTDIIMENTSQDTIANAYFLKTDVFIPRQIRKATIITSHFHRDRVRYIFTMVCGPEYMFDYIGVPEDIAPDEEKKIMGRQKDLTDKIKSFFGNMKPGDHEWLKDTFYSHPYYTEPRPEWVVDFVASGK